MQFVYCASVYFCVYCTLLKQMCAPLYMFLYPFIYFHNFLCVLLCVHCYIYAPVSWPVIVYLHNVCVLSCSNYLNLSTCVYYKYCICVYAAVHAPYAKVRPRFALCSSHYPTRCLVIGSLAIVFNSNYLTHWWQGVTHYTILTQEKNPDSPGCRTLSGQENLQSLIKWGFMSVVKWVFTQLCVYTNACM